MIASPMALRGVLSRLPWLGAHRGDLGGTQCNSGSTASVSLSAGRTGVCTETVVCLAGVGDLMCVSEKLTRERDRGGEIGKKQ